MKKLWIYALAATLLTSMQLACQRDTNYTYNVGEPVINVAEKFERAFFGDSLLFTAQVSDATIDLSTLKVQLFYTDDLVSETTIRTKADGTYSGKIYVPFYQYVPDGTATLKFVLQNISKKTTEKEFAVDLSRPDYPYLNLVTADKTYRMDKVGVNEYAVTGEFPFSVKGYIEAPKFGTNGNVLSFGWLDNAIALGNTTEIPFSNSTSGQYTISFNTLSFEAAPFIVAYAINGNVFNRQSDDLYTANVSFSEGQSFSIDGIEDIEDWWIDTDFVTTTDGKYTFNAITSKYRVTADFAKKYLRFELMNGNNPATLNSDGTGTIWLIGDGVGKPNVGNNHVGWNTDNALCLAPKGNKRYQITLIGDKTSYLDYLNFKFFHQKGWGGEFGHNSISTESDIIFVGNGNNGRDSGNIGLRTDKKLEAGKAYILTVDLSAGNDKAVITFEPQ